jgi:hypothetical protein
MEWMNYVISSLRVIIRARYRLYIGFITINGK